MDLEDLQLYREIFLNCNSLFEDDDEDEDSHELAELVLFPWKKRRILQRTDHFTFNDEEEFFRRFRLSKLCVRFIVDQIRLHITSRSTRCVACVYSSP